MKIYAAVNVVLNEVTAVHCFPGNFNDAVNCAAQMIYEQSEFGEAKSFDEFWNNQKVRLTSHFTDDVNYKVDKEITVSVIEVG